MFQSKDNASTTVNGKVGLRVLHVDDDQAFLEISKDILKMMGNFEVDQACCVDEAFKKLKTEDYDVVVSDYEMPQKNGLDFLKELREQKNEIPFILFTGKGREEVAIKALNLGADGYIDKQGNPEVVYGELSHTINQIVQHRNTKNELRQRDILLVELASQTPGMLFQFMRRPDGTYCMPHTSEAIQDIFGCSPQDVLDDFSPIIKAILPEDLDNVVRSIEDSATNMAPWQCEYRVQLPGQQTRWMWGQSIPRRLDDGSIIWNGYNADITERKQAEMALIKSEAKYRDFVESLPEIVFEIDLKGNLTFVNKRAVQITGYNQEEISVNFNFIRLIAPADRERAAANIKRLLSGENVGSNGYNLIKKDGTVFPVIIWANSVIVQSKVVGFRGIIVDISELKKMEAMVQEKLDILEAITENIGAGFVTISKDYRVLYANKFVKNNVGDVEGKHCYSSLNTLDDICPDCGVKKVFEDGVAKDSHEYSQIGVNGKPYFVELIATPLKDKEGNVTAALEFVVDIGEKKRMQQKLEANEAKFRAISDSAIDAIFMFDEDDKITYWNPAAERIFGYMEKEIVGQKVSALLMPIRYRKGQLSIVSELCKVANKTKEGDFLEVPALRKDGTEFPMEFSLAPLQLNDKTYFVAIARDIADRKSAEEKLNQTMNRLVLVNEKLGVVGGLTRHDVRNKLSIVSGQSYLLKKRVVDQEAVIDGLSKIEQAVKDSAKILDFAKMYEQLGVEELKYVDVEKTITEALSLFSGLNLKVINECYGLRLLADSLLRQLFYNFIDNTRKYGQKTTTIRIYYEDLESGGLQLVYEDDGVGISEENKLKLFSEGFSPGGGTGFGLFLISKMMVIYDWRIQEVGEAGKGVKFVITIPKLNKNGKENFQMIKGIKDPELGNKGL